MKLDTTKIKLNEAKSNHAMAAYQSEQCPIDRPCFWMATGFGGAITNKCQHLTDEGDCLHAEQQTP